jgi:FkbM family methyltransferase
MPLLQRIQRRLRRDAKIAQLSTLRALRGDGAYRDYGWIRLPFSGDGDLQEVYYHMHCQQWYRNEFARLMPFANPGDTVVDVGANLGFMATLFHRLTAPHGRVIALEPSPRIFRKLQRVVELNGLDRVEALNVGCGAETGTHTLYQVSDSSGNASLVPVEGEARGAGAEEVRLVRLDDLVAERDLRVDLLKVDTEGYESVVLAGAMATLARDRPAVYIELSQDYAESSEEAIWLLRELGYRFDPEPDLSRAHNGDNFLCTHPNRDR